jgi:hypothetical protein
MANFGADKEDSSVLKVLSVFYRYSVLHVPFMALLTAVLLAS